MGDLFDDLDNLNQAQQKPWMPYCKFILGTIENLAECVDACISNGRFGLDLETSGLDNRVKLIDGKYQTVDKIAGVCISPDGIKGYYYPLHHKIPQRNGDWIPHGANIPIKIFGSEFKRLMAAVDEGKTVAIFHHGKFDQEFLEYNETGEPWGSWDKPKSWDDTMIMGALRNSRARNRRLKDMSAALPEAHSETPTGGPGLGMEMIEIYELFGHSTYQKGFNYDFTILDPSEQQCLWYAGSDAICTYRLRDLLYPAISEADTDGQTQMTIYGFEKACVAATRWMERNRLHINRARVLELIQVGQKEWFDAILIVYSEAEKILNRDVTPGIYRALKTFFDPNDPQQLLESQLKRAESLAKHREEYKDPTSMHTGKDDKPWPIVYDVNSPQQLGTMFDEMGVPNLKRTEKSGQVATGKDEIEKIIDETGDQFPFMGKIRWFREINKALSTYLYPLYNQSDPEDDTGRINFRQDGTDTGRFTTPSKTDSGHFMVGWPQVNVQSIPKASDSAKHPECLNRVRECINCRPSEPGKPPKFMAAIDFSGEELRLITNLSREPKWLKEFFHCSGCDRMFDSGDGLTTPESPPARCPNCGSDKIGDIHTLTGLSIYGSDANTRPEWKTLRGHAKGLNFALCYGGGGAAAQRSVGVDKQEGWRIKTTFDRTYSVLKSWWDTQHAFARQHGFVRTAFFRKYPVPDINNADGGFRSKAERNAVNGPIQGSGADVCKIAMTLIYKEMKKRGWLQKVMMIMTMHDELVFEIDADILEETIPLLVNIMTRNSAVTRMNWPVPLTTDVEIGHDWTVPWHMDEMKYGEVRFVGNKKFKSKEKAEEKGYNWDQLQRYPDDLKPWISIANKSAPEAPSTPPAQQPPSTTIPPDVIAPVPPTAPQGDAEKVGAATIPMMDLPKEVLAAASGGVFEYRLSAPLTLGTLIKLADVIRQCRHRGTALLRLVSRTGEQLNDWSGGQDIRISPTTFYVLAQNHGI